MADPISEEQTVLALLPGGGEQPSPPEAKKVIWSPGRSVTADNAQPSRDFNERLLRSVLKVQTKSKQDKRMRDYLSAVIPMIAPDAVIVERDENIYVTKGVATVYPAVVAHLDTVHEIVPRKQFIILNARDMLFGWNPATEKHVGIGGDDKVGIFLALELLRTLPALKVAFFHDEEIGCVGSGKADLAFFTDCAFVLQGDRRGNDDFVKRGGGQSLYGMEFDKAVEPHLKTWGFDQCYLGAGTDVVAMRRKGLPICSTNVSCGYFNPHSAGEYVIMGDVERTLLLFEDIIADLGGKQWPHPPEAHTSYSHTATHSFNRGWDDARWGAWDGSNFRPVGEPNYPVSPGHWAADQAEARRLEREAKAKETTPVTGVYRHIEPDHCLLCDRPANDPCPDCLTANDDELALMEAKWITESRERRTQMQREIEEVWPELREEEDDEREDGQGYACPTCQDHGRVIFDHDNGLPFCMSCQAYLPGGD